MVGNGELCAIESHAELDDTSIGDPAGIDLSAHFGFDLFGGGFAVGVVGFEGVEGDGVDGHWVKVMG